MAAPTTWDDDDDLPANAGGPTARQIAILKEVIDALRLVGALLAAGGALATIGIACVDGIVPVRLSMISGLVTAPGVCYLVAASGLTRRRHWAWGMSLAVTALLIATLVAITGYLVWKKNASILCAMIPYISMPGLILVYMLRALPVVRDADLLIRKGFGVIPLARVANALPTEPNDLGTGEPAHDSANPKPSS